jgi:hypothetical protein
MDDSHETIEAVVGASTECLVRALAGRNDLAGYAEELFRGFPEHERLRIARKYANPRLRPPDIRNAEDLAQAICGVLLRSQGNRITKSRLSRHLKANARRVEEALALAEERRWLKRGECPYRSGRGRAAIVIELTPDGYRRVVPK